METTTKKIKYTWLNRLSYDDRQRIVNYYLEGYGLDRLGKTFGVTASTVEYHLKIANVFIPYKRPTLYGKIKKEEKRKEQANTQRDLVAPKFNLDTKQSYEDDRGEKCLMPRDYAYYIEKAARLARKYIQERQEIEQPKGFIVRVSLITNEIIYKQDFFSKEQYPMFVASNSLLSW